MVKAIESLYKDTCTVYEHQEVEDEDTGVTSFKWVEKYKKAPCRLSFSSIQPAVTETMRKGVYQNPKLFMNPKYHVLPGSKIEVLHEKRKTTFINSGEIAIYPSHQEIPLSLSEKKA